MKFYRIKIRPVALLEVLISFALIVLCVLPLISPHLYILKSERQFIHLVELDHSVNLLFANRLERLYQNKIPWEDIKSGREIPIDDFLFEEAGVKGKLPFKGSYRFIEEKHKQSPEGTEKAVYLFKLIFSFVKPTKEKDPEKEKRLEYTYLLAIERRQK